MSKVILMLTIIALNKAFALGGEVIGNGGDVVVCPGERPILLDLYEAKSNHGMTLRNDFTSTDPTEIALESLRDLRRLNPILAIIYERRIKKFLSNANYLDNSELADIPDSAPRVLPVGCKLKQLAIQKAKKLPTDKMYLIDNMLWSQMLPVDKAALIVHESVYTDFINLSHKTSDSARYLTGLLFSNLLEALSVNEYYKMLIQLRTFPIHDLPGDNLFWVELSETPQPTWSDYSDNIGLAERTCTKYGAEALMLKEARKHFKAAARIYIKLYDTQLAKAKRGLTFAAPIGKGKANYGVFADENNLIDEDNASRATFVVCRLKEST